MRCSCFLRQIEHTVGEPRLYVFESSRRQATRHCRNQVRMVGKPGLGLELLAEFGPADTGDGADTRLPGGGIDPLNGGTDRGRMDIPLLQPNAPPVDREFDRLLKQLAAEFFRQVLEGKEHVRPELHALFPIERRNNGRPLRQLYQLPRQGTTQVARLFIPSVPAPHAPEAAHHLPRWDVFARNQSLRQGSQSPR